MFFVKNLVFMIFLKMRSGDGFFFEIVFHIWIFKGCFGLGMVWYRVFIGWYDVILFGISCIEYLFEKIMLLNFLFVVSNF